MIEVLLAESVLAVAFLGLLVAYAKQKKQKSNLASKALEYRRKADQELLSFAAGVLNVKMEQIEKLVNQRERLRRTEAAEARRAASTPEMYMPGTAGETVATPVIGGEENEYPGD